MSKKPKAPAGGVRTQQGRVPLDADFGEPGQAKPSVLLAKGYSLVEASIDPGGLTLLLGKGCDLVLTRMVQVREGSGADRLVVTFFAKVP